MLGAALNTVAELLSVPGLSNSPEANEDGALRRALIVQGGGMRGVYSMAALAELDSAGLADSFDLVVAASAGAINGAYLLAGQAQEAVSVYVDLLSNRHFVNPFRLRKIVDIDYLVDTLKAELPLDIPRLRSSRTLLEVVLTNAETAAPEVVTNRDDGLDFYEVIRATAALPALYNKRVRIGQSDYIDGGTVDAVPVARAVDAGADRLLAVLTRSPGFRREDQSALFRLVGRSMARGQSPAVKAIIGKEDRRFNEAMDVLEGHKPGLESLHAWCVWPSDLQRLVARTTFDKDELRDCAAMARDDMRRVLSGAVEVA